MGAEITQLVERPTEKPDAMMARFFLVREFVYLLTCGRRSLVSETQNEIVVS